MTSSQVAARSAAAQLSPVSWHPNGEMSLAEWAEQGRRIGLVGRSVAWWIGDWLQYGNRRYGERYPRAARLTGYDVQSLMNMAWVAARFEPGRRRDTLSWSHHAEVAALSRDEQHAWLTRAEVERMSVRCLRTEVRASRRAVDAGPERRAPHFVCPNCGTPVRRSNGS